MDTLVVVAQQGHEYHGRSSRNHVMGPAPFGAFGSHPSNEFRDINVHIEPQKHSKSVGSKSYSDPIPISIKQVDSSGTFGRFPDNFLYSELWAGPAYSNSPPPSSVPIPKFSVVMPKRTVSLDSPSVSAIEIDLRPIAKSAPASPTGEHGLTKRDFFHSDEHATRNLRRILNLDLTDE